MFNWCVCSVFLPVDSAVRVHPLGAPAVHPEVRAVFVDVQAVVSGHVPECIQQTSLRFVVFDAVRSVWPDDFLVATGAPDSTSAITESFFAVGSASAAELEVAANRVIALLRTACTVGALVNDPLELFGVARVRFLTFNWLWRSWFSGSSGSSRGRLGSCRGSRGRLGSCRGSWCRFWGCWSSRSSRGRLWS